MSTLIIEPTAISEIKAHPNADLLEIAVVKGWQVITGKGNHKAGDVAIYVPPDSIVPLELSDKWDVTKYLSKQRVKAVRLRGEMSYGFLAPNDENFPVGENVAEKLGITKYEPPEEVISGDRDRDHVLFHYYTNIENYRNYPDWFQDGETVTVTEKIHGTNSRVGMVIDDENSEGKWLVGSHKTIKKMDKESLYHKPLTDDMRAMVLHLKQHWPEDVKSIIVFGEIYGGGIQDLKYGSPAKHQYRCFDIAVNARYLNFNEVTALCAMYGIDTVPELYRGAFSVEKMKALASGTTVLVEKDPHIREGIVIKPVVERPTGQHRTVLKLINDDYLLRKKGTEKH